MANKQIDFEFQPTLTGQLVFLRPMAEEDWEGLFAAAADPEIWAVHPARNRYKEPEFRQFFTDAMASGSAFTFVERERGAIIGSSRYHGFDPQLSEIEVGWTFLTREYWGGSYNAEIKKLMLDHAFRFVDTVVFWVGEKNFRSQRAMEKIGGVRRDGLQPRAMGTVIHQHYIYEIRK